MAVFGQGREIHNNLLFGFLALIYDGERELPSLRTKIRTLFISSTRQGIVEDEDIEEFLQNARDKGLIFYKVDGTVDLTPAGVEIVELGYPKARYLRVILCMRLSRKRE